MKNEKKYLRIIRHLENCLQVHGDTPKGVDWPNKRDTLTRYRVMLDVAKEDQRKKKSLLDFGCGPSHLYEYMLKNKIRDFRYSGLDISPDFVQLSQKKFPHLKYYCKDILNGSHNLPKFDYVVMNGVFTVKLTMSHREMKKYTEKLLKRVFQICRKGMAFNVMSKLVDWERRDLFHLPFNDLGEFLFKNLSRQFVFRYDYGLYEYTAYVYKKAQ